MMGLPPSQAWSSVSHDTSCCTESATGFEAFLLIEIRDSVTATALWAQQLPHCPWLLTGVRTPFARQSMLTGGVAVVDRGFTTGGL